MKKSNLKLSLVALSLVSAAAWADPAYVCETTLEYRVANEYGQPVIRSIPMYVNGAGSTSNGMSGEAYVQAGARSSFYNQAWARVSPNYIDVSGALNNGEAFSITYRGDESPYSWARYTVRHNGYDVTATNEVISTEDPNDSYPVVCEVTDEVF